MRQEADAWRAQAAAAAAALAEAAAALDAWAAAGGRGAPGAAAVAGAGAARFDGDGGGSGRSGERDGGDGSGGEWECWNPGSEAPLGSVDEEAGGGPHGGGGGAWEEEVRARHQRRHAARAAAAGAAQVEALGAAAAAAAAAALQQAAAAAAAVGYCQASVQRQYDKRQEQVRARAARAAPRRAARPAVAPGPAAPGTGGARRRSGRARARARARRSPRATVRTGTSSGATSLRRRRARGSRKPRRRRPRARPSWEPLRRPPHACARRRRAARCCDGAAPLYSTGSRARAACPARAEKRGPCELLQLTICSLMRARTGILEQADRGREGRVEGVASRLVRDALASGKVENLPAGGSRPPGQQARRGERRESRALPARAAAAAAASRARHSAQRPRTRQRSAPGRSASGGKARSLACDRRMPQPGKCCTKGCRSRKERGEGLEEHAVSKCSCSKSQASRWGVSSWLENPTAVGRGALRASCAGRGRAKAGQGPIMQRSWQWACAPPWGQQRSIWHGQRRCVRHVSVSVCDRARKLGARVRELGATLLIT